MPPFLLLGGHQPRRLDDPRRQHRQGQRRAAPCRCSVHSGCGCRAAPAICRASRAAMLAHAQPLPSPAAGAAPMAAPRSSAVPGRPTIDRAGDARRPIPSGPAPTVPASAAAVAAIARSPLPLKR
eukprot:scaffold1249_cov122-Isochrysis_galbana.AAC.5